MAFELGLRRAGLNIEEAPGGQAILTCETTLVSGDGYTIAGMVKVYISELALSFARTEGTSGTQYVTSWSRHFVFTAPNSDLDGKKWGERCAETFELDWRRANN